MGDSTQSAGPIFGGSSQFLFLIFQLAPSIFHRFHIVLHTISPRGGFIFGPDAIPAAYPFIDLINKIAAFIVFLHLCSLPECAILLGGKV